ncbi:germinal-center associated nuclear protein [Melanotaenia boesemani]|uniref:germinal-center associated nuclear protein n=1 Tax=Melanotaenia boesemani TaxID=1250792 RepID=UPI001C04D647|nr:germinal-center associated nuclear protein [Melanotaenia boesemani]
MNPTNPFGSPQGAFQAPSTSVKTGLFQSFGQQSSNNQAQSMGFFQPPAFGQPSVLSQPAAHGNTIFGQAPTFGQPPAQPPSLPTISQAPAFGQPSLGMNSSGFASGTTPAFGQTTGLNQSSVFGQTPAFGQPSAFGQAPGFGKPPPAFGQQSSGFGNSQMATGSTTTPGQPQPLNFGQSMFGQPSTTSGSASVFGAAQSVTQSRAFGSSEFSFKPANEALFKPIFSVSPEPANPQTTTVLSSAFGVSGPQTGSNTMSSSTTTTTNFSLLTAAKSGPHGFSFSQPAAPSVSAQNNPPTTGTSSSATGALQFTFSQPAAPSSSSTTEPTTPSSFSFTTKTLQTQPAVLLGGAVFGQPSAFGDIKAKAEISTDEKGSSLAVQGDTNIFARFSKGTKRKDDPAAGCSGPEKSATEEDVPAGADSPRHPSKRPLIRSRGLPGGLFSRALSGIRRDRTNPVKRDVSKEPQTVKWEENNMEEPQAQYDDLSATPSNMSRDVLEKPEVSDSSMTPDPAAEGLTPKSRGAHRDSLDSLSGISPSDLTSIQCRDVPAVLNKKDLLEKHFARFGKVCRIICRPAKNVAIIHFDDHAAAAKAKKRGKVLHRHELLLLWQKKKSPGEKGSKPAPGKEESEEKSQQVPESKAASSPLRRPTLRPAALSSSHTFSSSVMKSSPVKVLQFDTEPQKETSTETQSLERPVPSSLLHLIGQVAETTEEKYRLLEQKDKILRQDRPKRTDLLLSSVFVGTCPDMCPEKERYMRETRNQLSVFEVIPETEMVDHSAAIKEYSRSSADQEEPLPHELRPLPVLSMTMDYLVTQIMDQVQDNYRDWYDFVWNRTRGIRKDITQQRLCCPHTVSLIEKCTRFHVHCAHHLCEEPMMSFDAKINNENMTKCLQSLKEMYEDLATQQTFCPHEAEFRQYSVLLKLNDGDILREVQQFRHEVRKSPEVKFAVQAFAAVSSNNFVRFFKLVKGASYLASCLLHRYFNQVRAKALKALNMAHTVGPRSTPFPVEDVVRMLMFRNAEEATDFIQQYGLNVNDGVVDLSRTAFQEPELPLSQRKSEVILTKKMALVGQVVNGGPLPNPPQHRPVCSFDSQNKYRREGPLAEPTSSFVKAVAANVEVAAPPSTELATPFILVNAPDVPSEFLLPPAVAAETGEPSESYHPPSQAPDPQQLFQPIPQPQPVRPPSPPPKPQLVYTDEDIMSALDCLIEEVVEVAVREVANDGASYAAAALTESSAQLESLASEVLGQMLQEISSNEIKLEQECVAEEKRKLEEARRRQEHEAFLAQFSCSLCTEVIHEVLDETIQETASSEIQKALNEKAERVAKCTEQVCSSLIDETLNIDIALLVEDILEAELQRIHKYIKRWRDVVAVRRQLKRQMRGFPAAPCCVDPRFKLKALAPSAPAQPSTADLARGLVNLGNAGTLALSSTRLLKMRRDAIHQMRVHFCYQQLLEEMAWAPLDLPALVTENIPNAGDQIFWKALLLLPSDHESVASLADRILSGWLEVKLGGDPEPEEQPDGVLQTLCISTVLQESGQRTHKVHVTVKAARGPLTEDSLSKVEESCELQGTGALIMLLPALPGVTPGQEEQDVPLLSALLQLKQLQKANTWHCPLPLVVLVPGPDRGAAESQNLEEALMLHTLMKEGLISEYIFFFIPETTSDLQGPKQLNQALCWLLARAPPPFPLSCQTLVQLVEATLSREFSSRVYANRQDRTAAGLPSQGPAPVIQLYNSVLAHVADQVASQDLCRLSWPPGEFCVPDTCGFVPHLAWNSAQHLSWLRTAILSLQLPEWQQPCPTDSWTELCSSILCYAATIPSSRHSQPVLMSRLENLLERIRLKARHAKSRVSRVSGGSSGSGLQNDHEAFTLVPWDDVVVICIDHKLKDWQIPEPPVCKDAVTEDGEILVYFPTESSSGFQPPAEWTQAVRQTHREKQQQMDRASAAACAPSAGSSPRQRLFHSLMEPVEAPPAPLDITHTATAQELLAHRVLQSLQEEKAESKRSMEQLQRWVDGDPLDHLSTPLFVPSSTLLSTPTTIKWVAREKSREAAFTQKPEPDEPLEKEALRKTTPVSLAWRLKDLERQILASQEEELACKLKLSGLLSIVED